MIYSPTICLANRRSRNRLSGPLMDRIDFHVAARYSEPAAFFIASTASSAVSSGVVLTALQAPPAAKTPTFKNRAALAGDWRIHYSLRLPLCAAFGERRESDE